MLQTDRKSLDRNQNIKPSPFLGYLSNNIECFLCHHKVCILNRLINMVICYPMAFIFKEKNKHFLLLESTY